jgi:hypothetical protein
MITQIKLDDHYSDYYDNPSKYKQEPKVVPKDTCVHDYEYKGEGEGWIILVCKKCGKRDTV